MSMTTDPIASESMVSPPPRLHMTEEEFVKWYDEDVKAEWVDGEVIIMSPVSGAHDDTQWWIRNLLQFYVDRRDLGLVRGPEFMIRLAKQRRRRVPDIIFVSKQRLDSVKECHVEGPPDLSIEIVSPDSESRDWREKYLEYEAAGVREYWVIDPMSQHIEAYALGADQKYVQIEEKDDKITSVLLPGWYVRPNWLFGEKRADVMAALGELGIR
jgi:Uma2 family endonuclease